MAALFRRVGAAADHLVRRYMPDPFVLVLLLSIVALALGYASASAGPDPLPPGARLMHVVGAWGEGLGNAELLKFGFQIVLIVVTGEAITESPPVARALARLTALPRTASQALVLVTLFALVTGWLHWGFGLVASALLAREVGRSCAARGIAVPYALLGMGAYTSMLLWHAGLTASAPLLMNTEKNFVSEALGLAGPAARVPLTETVLAPYNLVACGLLTLIVPFVIVALTPAAAESEAPGPPPVEEERGRAKEGATATSAAPGPATPAERLDAQRWPPRVVGLLGLGFFARHLAQKGFDLNHNVVNAAFLMLGLTLHPTPTSYARAIAKSVRGTSGIVLQFPFYGGILAVMTATGLSERIAHVFIEASTAQTLPFFTFVASVLTKSFVPSGAGEWAVEGPVMLKAAQALGVPFGKVTMGVAYGNMLGNMYQPFWSLPLLGLMGLRARDIMGFGLVLFVVCFPILGAAMLWG